MPPKRKAPGEAAAAGKGKSKKVYGKAPELPSGELLTDFSKKEWRLGHSIGSGGFGRIYLASRVGEKAGSFVVKMEPATNGPLFQEIHVYQRVAKEDMVNKWRKEKGLKFLGIPPFVAAGLHSKNGTEFRFLVMPRYGADLESHRETCEGGRLDPAFVFRLSLCCLDSLEYLHRAANYVHADLKGENLLAASDKAFTTGDQFYLVDYGLAKKVPDQPVYKEVPKNAHDGTLIFTSLDAHRGCAPSYRGDVEILGYNIIYWITGSLPWIKDSAENVFEKKVAFSKSVKTEMGRFPLLAPFGLELTKFFDSVYRLDYPDRPDFDQLRQYLQQALIKTKKSGRSSSSATASSPARTSVSKVKARSPARTPRQQSPVAKQNGASTVKKTPRLLQEFEDDGESESDSASDEEGKGGAGSSSKRFARPPIKKTILADDTPSPSPARRVSPRSIIPGKANLRRYDPKAVAQRRSSIMVKKKYLAPKKTVVVSATVTTSTRPTRGAKKSYRISSSDDDE